jgi:pimeloyl-ACP methyl ester carboxylesterase
LLFSRSSESETFGKNETSCAGAGFTRTDTDIPGHGTDLPLSGFEAARDDKGPLGLTTLFEPPSPARAIADIIFIHGLGGGSRKTWSYSNTDWHFWPQSWLSTDPDFAEVRIHTFGYKANWVERQQSVLNIDDFAQSLVGALKNSPSIRRESTGIVLVGHSMGGCVAKKAYLLAHQDPMCQKLATRVNSMFFLGTPHRGSDMAAVLRAILAVTWGKKPFVTDLKPNSSTLAAINDSFRHISKDLRLWSFFETLPVKATGIGKRIVVEKHSATLGYHNEDIDSMNADHRHVCKFDSPDNPDYKKLRNALCHAVDMIRMDASSTPTPTGAQSFMITKNAKVRQGSSAQVEAFPRLRCFLGVQDSPESELATFHLLKQPGSCQWFTEKACFASWKEGTAPRILWLTGKPAAGKSILFSHVIENLSSSPVYCSYFIFGQTRTGKATLSDCFKSLAFQMAVHDALVKERLLDLEKDGISWDRTDDTSVWRNLFVTSIFKLPSITQHFWVIDGIDQCTHFNSLFTKRFLATIPEELRIFATSRNVDEIDRGVASLGRKANLVAMSDSDTLEDMRLLLNTRLRELGRLRTDEEREAMCEKILAKSAGSFLWTWLVLQEFERAWTEEAMESILTEIPADLHELYRRMVQSIEADKCKAMLAKSILTWVALASRPLTVTELRSAVKLDINQTLQNVAKAIPDLCGQLVFIDHRGKVQMIHETAREFLVSGKSHSELAIVKRDGHERLGSLLLQYLCGDVLKPQLTKPQQIGGRGRGFAKPCGTAPSPDSSLLEYAVSFFSDHVYRSASAGETLMVELCSFLKANSVLAWIEHVAKSGDLNIITRTATNLRGYVFRRTRHVPPTDMFVQLIDGWVTDLIRVTARFRAQLLACPSSIYCLIPPLCPSDSMIAKTFAKDTRLPASMSALTVKGLTSESWDDCLIRMDFQIGQATAVSHGNRFFAIGLSTGQIMLYDPSSLQEVWKIAHPERVKILEFSCNDRYLASCGTKHLAVWETKSGTNVQKISLSSVPLAIAFLEIDELLCAFQSGEISKWWVRTAALPSQTIENDIG